jgi:hypothetical protein
MDDNVLPLDPGEALDWTRSLEQALGARRVDARRLAFSLQLRADAVTDEVADALVRLGLVRAYVGIDGYSPEQLRSLGRRAAAGAGAAALGRLWARGVFPVCNALLLGPTIPFESVVAEVAGLARVRHAPVHLLPLDVRAGTAYFAAAERAGLVEGGPLWRHWRCADERTALVARVLTALPTRLAERSVPIALYDLGYNLGIARRLVPEAEVSAQAALYARVTEAWNADQLRLLALATEAAAARDPGRADALAQREAKVVRAHDEALVAACDEALAAVERAVGRARRAAVRAHARGRMLSAVALSMGLAACKGSANNGTNDAAASPDSATSSDAAMFMSDGAGQEMYMCPGGRATGTPPPMPTCCNGSPPQTVHVTFDGMGVASTYDPGDGGILPPDVLDCLQAFFGSYCFPSLASQTTNVTTHCWIA